MRYASSALSTCSARASIDECTATVRIASRRQVRITRQAISPRLAIRIFLNMKAEGCLNGLGRSRAALAMRARRPAGPCLERAEERRGLRVAEVGGDLRDAVARLLEARERGLAPHRILDGAIARSFVVQAPMQRSRRKAELTGGVAEGRPRREVPGEELAHGAHHLPIAPVEHRDLARRAFEEYRDLGLVAAHPQVEERRSHRPPQPARAEGQRLRVVERVVAP